MVTIVAVGKTVTLSTTAKPNKFTLVIDAGHGGNDAGAIGAITLRGTRYGTLPSSRPHRNPFLRS